MRMKLHAGIICTQISKGVRVPFPRNGNPGTAEVRFLAFLGNANPFGFFAPDVPGNGSPNLKPLQNI